MSDAVNAALTARLTSDATMNADTPGGAWNLRADEDAPLTLVKFQLVVDDPSYVFHGTSSRRLVYKVTAHAEDTPARAGATSAAVVADHVLRVLTDAPLAPAGFTLLSCMPYAAVPPDVKPGRSGKDEYSAGWLVEIIVAPN